MGPNGSFDRYVRPKVPIDAGAAKVTGITCREGHMYYRDEPVDCVSLTQALNDFMSFLGEGRVVLVGHNICSFDAPILVRTANYCGLVEKLKAKIFGFLDTLTMFRGAYPQLNSYKQEQLYKHFVGGEYNAHNALGDVMALKELHLQASPPDVAPYTFNIEHVQKTLDYRKQKTKNVKTWQKVIDDEHGYITKPMATRAASSGLSLHHLEKAFQRGGREAVEEIFQEVGEDGQARVTKKKKVIDKFVEYFQTMWLWSQFM